VLTASIEDLIILEADEQLSNTIMSRDGEEIPDMAAHNSDTTEVVGTVSFLGSPADSLENQQCEEGTTEASVTGNAELLDGDTGLSQPIVAKVEDQAATSEVMASSRKRSRAPHGPSLEPQPNTAYKCHTTCSSCARLGGSRLRRCRTGI